ncbi:ABC transporter permease [Corynebacterium ammoniagenes]|jgi:oligopeptide transport system permease protein|uniref:ABC transporter permease n=2 Tax=Corynebacterium ammoniagenes TaxID=1697 RepID=A0AAV5GAS4_CORAM|nr:ABC transporter permease [Corynebacterium ammoniagenes]APT81679.1 peptide ABC transporter permease [Corynebacterium ammoniagenes DSM 20306]AQS72797.1 peptide ABC transporter permease [Corynebacterium ammoniagenes]EFG82207.1 ABC transporter, permease protein [Corynebacterium ammoniagenes DSM 20306]NMF32319.1 ABC transporter permease [Corynebacterium ammoniagenes]GJN43818.1 ABC transporter permease [Corynebacterium ammoniagenes]
MPNIDRNTDPQELGEEILVTHGRPGQGHFIAETDETGLGAVDAVKDESAPSSQWTEAWRYLRKRPLFWVASVMILIALLLAIFPSLFTSVDPRACDLGRSLNPSEAGHIFGFDRQGCDIYSRVIYGARASVLVGVLTTALVTVVGALIGSIAGFFGGWVDTILSRITDIFFAIPLVLAAIVVMQMFKEYRTIVTVVLVLGLFGWVSIARITRGAVMSIKNEEFVQAARSIGASRWRILFSHVLPNAAAPIISYATVALGTFIVAEATLSFLGIGLPPTIVSWGGDISQAQASLRQQPLVLFYPAGALALTVLSFIMMGDVVRDALDPKARKR